jgi:uncharacterized protein DUF5615
MRVLLDECIPRKLKNSLLAHDCRTVLDEGWAGKKNGELLARAEEYGFAAFLTLDRGIEYQQNLQPRNIAVILIRTKSNRLADIVTHVPAILKMLESVKPGQLVKVG